MNSRPSQTAGMGPQVGRLVSALAIKDVAEASDVIADVRPFGHWRRRSQAALVGLARFANSESRLPSMVLFIRAPLAFRRSSSVSLSGPDCEASSKLAATLFR